MEKIYTPFTDFNRILSKAGPIVSQQFALASLIEEVHATSTIEGIHSTHRELNDILDGSAGNIHFICFCRPACFTGTGWRWMRL